MAKRTQNQPGSINVKGNVDTGGGDMAAGDIKKRDVYQARGLNDVSIQNLFQPVYQQIQSQDQLSKDDKEDLTVTVKEIEQAAVKEDVDETFIERRLRNIARMAPDILDVVLKTLSNPVVGLASIAQKIAQKAGKDSPVKKNVNPG